MYNSRTESGTLADLDQEIASNENLARSALREAEADPDHPDQDGLLDVQARLLRALRFRHARGDSAAELEEHFRLRLLPDLQRAGGLTRRHFPGQRPEMRSWDMDAWLLLLALACFDTGGGALERIGDWVDTGQSSAPFHLLLKAFVPGHAYPRKFARDATSDAYEKPVAGAVLAAPPERQKALHAFLRQWPAIMAPHGYRRDAGDGAIFTIAPFHAALAACAYDIDDAAFRDLPDYPGELVAWYRVHVRQRRDAWRGVGVGAGDDLPAPLDPAAQGKKLTPSAAYTRWIEIVCGDSAPLTATAREALGPRKTMPDLFNAMEALAGAGLALQADIKDDETLAHQVQRLCATRGWPAFTPPAEPPQGPARVSAILSALRPWLAERGQTLALLGDGGDAWQAVVFKAADEARFAALCDQLQIDVQDE